MAFDVHLAKHESEPSERWHDLPPPFYARWTEDRRVPQLLCRHLPGVACRIRSRRFMVWASLLAAKCAALFGRRDRSALRARPADRSGRRSEPAAVRRAADSFRPYRATIRRDSRALHRGSDRTKPSAESQELREGKSRLPTCMQTYRPVPKRRLQDPPAFQMHPTPGNATFLSCAACKLRITGLSSSKVD